VFLTPEVLVEAHRRIERLLAAARALREEGGADPAAEEAAMAEATRRRIRDGGAGSSP
jgi:hypothetical protein